MAGKLSQVLPLLSNAARNFKTGDLFSPVLVKEVRQGMRTRTFVGVFLLVQVVMMFTMIVSAYGASASDGDDNVMGMATVVFWGVISIPLALIMPARGLNAVGTEIRMGTLEPLHLTRLSSWRIVFGKWFSLFAQTMLLLISLLPFAMLRYFLGGVNIVDELQIIGCLVLASALLTALTVGSSAFQSIIWRIFLVIGIIVGIIVVLGIIGSIRSFGYAMGGSPAASAWSDWGWLLFLFECGVVGYLLLEYGASEIAPPAENHAIRKRIAAFVILGCAYLFWKIGGFQPIIVLSMLIVLIVVGLALIERPVVIRTLYARNATRPALVRFLVRQFYPGWPFALFFCIIVWAVCAMMASEILDDTIAVLRFGSVLASLIWSAAVTHLLLPSTRRPVGFFVLLQIACLLLYALAAALESVRVIDTAFWLIPFPPAVFWYSLAGSMSARHEMLYLGGVAFMGVLSLVVLAIRGRSIRRQVVAIEREFRERKRAAKASS